MLTPDLPVTNKPLAPTGMRTSGARRRSNRAQIVALLAAMGALLGYCGWIVAGWDGIAWSVIGGTVGLVLLRRVPVDMFLKAMRARPLLPGEAPGLQVSFVFLCRRAGLSPIPCLYHIDETLPLAFGLGAGEAAAIVVADSLLAGLTQRELCAILAHEIVHLRNGDILLQQLGLVLGWLTRVLSQLGFFLVLVGLAMHVFSLGESPLFSLLVLATAPIGVGLLRLALSRAREAEADLEAAELTGDPAALASALVKLRRWQERLLRQWFPTAHPLHLPTLFDDHPPTEERIRRLMGLSRRAGTGGFGGGPLHE
jgi:heat shock protein HtpX